MSKVQKVYRELRNYMSREEARYAAPRVVTAWKEYGTSHREMNWWKHE